MKNKFKILFLTFLIAVLCFASIPTKTCYAWGAMEIVAQIMDNMWEFLMELIRSVVVQALKNMAVEMITSKVNSMISGGGSENALIITDWVDFLVDKPSENALVYLNDLYTSTSGGRSSVSNYSANGGAEGIMGNYSAMIEESTKKSIMGEVAPMTIQEYTNNPSDLFGQGNWRAFDSYFSNSSNNPFGSYLTMSSLFEEKLATEKEKAQTKAIAYQGYKSSGGDGSGGDMVSTPGSTIKDIQASTNSIGDQALATAKGMAEVVAGMVVKVATKSIKQGIGKAKSNFQREVSNTTGRFNSQVRQKSLNTINKPSY